MDRNKSLRTTDFSRPRFAPDYKRLGALFMGDENYLNSLGIYKTSNQMGFSYMKMDSSVAYWISSLTESGKPLLDLGAGLGFQTATAIRSGRDVISVDLCQKNLKILEENVKKVVDARRAHSETKPGRLLETIEAAMPNSDLFEKECCAGILLSEVIHFMSSKDVVKLFSDAFQWLENGGLLIVTTGSPALFRSLSSFMKKPISDDGMERLWELVEAGSEDEVMHREVFELSTPSSESVCPRRIIFRSTNELFLLASRAGFDVKYAMYISPENCPVLPGQDEITMLVAQKPK